MRPVIQQSFNQRVVWPAKWEMNILNFRDVIKIFQNQNEIQRLFSKCLKKSVFGQKWPASPAAGQFFLKQLVSCPSYIWIKAASKFSNGICHHWSSRKHKSLAKCSYILELFDSIVEYYWNVSTIKKAFTVQVN